MSNAVMQTAPSYTLRFLDKVQQVLKAGRWNGEENYCFSGLSAQMCLHMLLVGSEKNTKSQLTGLINGYGTEIVSPSELALNYSVNSLNVSNSIWLANNLRIHYLYDEHIVRHCKGTLNAVDFKNPVAAIQQINNFCSQQTDGKLPEILGPNSVTRDTRLVALNTILFKGVWQKPFPLHMTANETFYGSRRAVDTPMMFRRGECEYFEGDGIQAINLPYSTDGISALLVMDSGKHDLSYVYNKALDGLRLEERVYVYVPRFKTESEIDLRSVCLDLGCVRPFSDYAEFWLAADEKVKIDNIVQKVCVEVDEKGTEAAAATVTTMVRLCTSMSSAKNYVFNANRPFMWFIHDAHRREVLFNGYVSQF